MNGQIFISYRREESRWSTRSLYDRLCAHFDRKQIFMDIDAIALGDDFVKAIEKTVGECDVLIAVIGARWLISKDEHDGRRLDNPEDFVRREIATALKREIRVIPVLVDGALMPRSTELADDLKPLIRRNALQVTDTGFDDDCRRLVGAIVQILEGAKAGRREREEKERREAKRRATEAKERLEADRRQEKEQRRLEHRPHSPPPGPVAAATSPDKRKMGPAAGIMTLLALGICLCVVAVIYFGSRRPGSKATTPEPVPRLGAVSPMANSSPQPATPSPTPSEAERLAKALTPSPSAKLTGRSAPTPRPTATAVNPLSETSIRQFIERHLRSVENHNLDAYLSAYNDRVKWYGKGFVTMDYIRADIKSFLHKWSDIRYEIVGSIQIDELSEGSVRASYMPSTERVSRSFFCTAEWGI